MQDQQLTAKVVPWSNGRREKAVPSIEEKERRCKGERREQKLCRDGKQGV